MHKFNYERLSAQDNSFLLFEKPGLYMHVSATQIFELGPLRSELGGVDFERIKAFIASVLHRIPRYSRASHQPAAAGLGSAAEEARGPRDGAAA